MQKVVSISAKLLIKAAGCGGSRGGRSSTESLDTRLSKLIADNDLHPSPQLYQ